MHAKHAAIYVRVSSDTQKHASQMADLERWTVTHGLPVKWYYDTFTARTQQRPGWQQLEHDLRAGKLTHLVCHKLDRLGRTARELLALFDVLRNRKVQLNVVASGIIGLDTPEARLMTGIIANFAEYDNEVRTERIILGQAAARARGVKWGGSKAGVAKKVTPEKLKMIRQLKADGTPITKIALAVNLCRSTIYAALNGTTTGAA